MKKIQLLSILILFISFFGVQSVVGQIEKNGKYYLIYDENSHRVNAAEAINLKLSTYDKLQYPNTGTLTVKSYIQKILGRSDNSTLYLYETISGTENKKETPIEKGGNWNNETFSVNKNATKIRFEVAYHLLYYREIDDVILPMAPHILLSDITLPGKADDESKTIGEQNTTTATSTKKATINFGSMRNNAETRTATIKIKSCLSTGNIATTLSDTPRGFSITGGVSGGGNTFVAINNGNDIIVTFDPTQAGVTTTTGSQTITETITILDDGNTGNNVVITLTAKVNPPKSQTITWPEFTKTLRIGDVITLNKTASSGLDIDYTSNNTNIATINGNKMTIVGAGEATITASQEGDAEYAAARETKTIITKQYNVSNLRSTETGYKYIKLSWDAIGGADDYSIYEGDTEMGRITETYYTITGVTYSESHTYKIKTNDEQSYTTQSSGSETTITTPAYPQVQNVHFTNVQQNQVTVNWDPVTISLANHEFVCYHVHFYENAAGTGTTGIGITTTETSYKFDGLIDQTQYTAYVDVEYKYTLNGETIYVKPDGNHWSSKSVITASFIPNEPFDGVERVQGEWYRIMSNSTKTLVEGTTLWGSTTGTYTMTLNYPCNNLSYQAWLSDNANADHTISDDAIGENQNLSDGKIYTRPTQSIDTSKTQIVFTGTQGYLGSQTIYLDNIYAKIAPHIRLKPLETNTLETEIGTAKSLPLNVNFKSFLAMGNMTITSSDPQFLIDGNLESKTIECGANYLCKTDNTSHNFSIVYMPKSVDTHTATITITDGTSTETIELTGICKKNTPTITWVANKQLVYGTNLANAASSDCGTAITYTSANKEIIKIENNELVPVGLGTTTITATTTGNDRYESISSEAEFEVVDKDIQIVVWEQDFYLLKLGDDKIPLNAYTIDNNSKEQNGLPVEYSSANTNIVTVNEGFLHIVGKGQTTITAHQRGNDKYAGTYMTKTVIVREVSNDCSSEYALVDDGKNWDRFAEWEPVTYTCKLSTAGEYLTFTTTKTGGLLPTTGGKITVTDEHGVQFHSGDLGTTEKVKINHNTRELTFTLEGNRTIGISEILVTQATYLEAIDKTVSFQTQYGATGNASIYFNWANQPDFIWAKIIDDANGVFSIAAGTNIIEATCGKCGTNFVNLKFTPKAAGEYTAKLVLGVGQSEEIKETINITATAHKGYQAITWTDALTTADRQVQIAKSDKNIPILYEIISGTGAEVADNGNSISVIDANTFIVRAYNDGSTNYNPISAEKEFTSTIGTIKFDNSNGNNSWNNSANWLPINTLNTQRNVEPSAMVNAVISAEAVVSNAGQDEINNLTFENGGKLTVNPTSGLKANEVTNATANNLILEASDKGNATFIYNSGTPSATVEMYSKATGAVNNGTPQWQYMGVAVDDVDGVDGATTSNFPNAWLLKWTESQNVNGDPWSKAPLAPGTPLDPWAGYSISQPKAEGETYRMKGALMNGDHTYELTRTESTDPDCGFNLLANSYTAPIDITKLTTDDFENADARADACIILYNTGTYAEWEQEQGNSGEQAGQLTVIPIETVGATDLPKTIPSMQAFFVMAQEDGATFTVNYDTDVAGASNHSNQMRAPRAENEFNVLKIMIEGENTRDRLYLLENEETSKAYDNGYEARKIFDAPRGHQMYATCEYGYASIDCSESFVGQTIGLKGDNEGEMLTISFDIDRLEGYESLYLYDKVTGKYVNIVAGEKYTFFGVKGADDNRFSIVTNPDDRNQTPPFVVIGEELAFDKSQINADNANIYIYDTSGRLLITDKVNPYENYNIPNMPKGIYLVSMNGYTTKIVKK